MGFRLRHCEPRSGAAIQSVLRQRSGLPRALGARNDDRMDELQ